MGKLMSNDQEHWVVDAGNTRTKLVIFENDEVMQVMTDDAAEEYGRHALASGQLPRYTLIAASGELASFWNDWIEKCARTESGLTSVFQLESAEVAELESTYAKMDTLGLDRAANARAVLAEESESNWLVIDIGTCITVDWIEAGKFSGGSIAPGIDLRLRAMYAGTSNLPYPENWREAAMEGVGLHLGSNTIECLLAGAIGGVNAELQQRIEAFHIEFGDFRVALTGGDAECLELRTRCPIFADPNLTWKGFNLILKDLVQKQ
jgi:type III pantothenate kinase